MPASGQENDVSKKALGVFSVPSYISLSDQYIKNKVNDPRLKGKQFIVPYPKEGKTADAFFDKKDYKWLLQNKKFEDTQPQRFVLGRQDQLKKGFLSSDANKRAEFSNVCRVEQWRQTLAKEQKYNTVTSTMEFKRTTPPPTKLAPVDGHIMEFAGPENLYDISRAAETKFCRKCTREQFYCPHQKSPETKRRLGKDAEFVTSTEVGMGAQSVHDDTLNQIHEYARRPIIQNSFYRVTRALPGIEKNTD